MMIKHNWQAVGKIGLLGLVYFFLTRLISEIAFLLAQPMYQPLRAFDPDGSFLYISLHHLWQGLFALLVIPPRNWSCFSACSGFSFRAVSAR